MPPLEFHRHTGRGIAIDQVIECFDAYSDRLHAIFCVCPKRWSACYALKGMGSEGGQHEMDVTSDASWVATSSELFKQIPSSVSTNCRFSREDAFSIMVESRTHYRLQVATYMPPGRF